MASLLGAFRGHDWLRFEKHRKPSYYLFSVGRENCVAPIGKYLGARLSNENHCHSIFWNVWNAGLNLEFGALNETSPVEPKLDVRPQMTSGRPIICIGIEALA
jgi:hypothetical protein